MMTADGWIPVLQKCREAKPEDYNKLAILLDNQFNDMSSNDGTVQDFTRFALPLIIKTFNKLTAKGIDVQPIVNSILSCCLRYIGPDNDNVEKIIKAGTDILVSGMNAESYMADRISDTIVNDIISLNQNPFKLRCLLKENNIGDTVILGDKKSFVMEYIDQ